MRSTRQRDTGAELAIRSAAHQLGLRYFVDRRPMPELRTRADLVFPRQRIAVFIDGCFWHGCPEHGTVPRANAEWWITKLEANRARDARATEALEDAGWTVIRIWEHEDPELAAQQITAEVRRRR